MIATGPVANRKYTRLLLAQRTAFNTFIPFDQEGGALLFHWPGYVFLLDGKGAVRKTIRIYEEFDEGKLPSLNAYEPVLLGAALGPGGTLLLAVRGRDGVLKSHDFYPAPEVDGTSTFDPEVSINRAKDRLRQFSEIEWWEIDIESGDLSHSENAPFNSPFCLLNSRGENLFADGFPFIVEASGQVRMMNN